MTQQYLAGELSFRLGQVQAATPDRDLVHDVGWLRQEAETLPPGALALVASRALALIDQICLESLQRGDSGAFVHQVTLGGDLYEFATCSGLFEGGEWLRPAQ